MSALLWGEPLFQFLDVSQKSNLVALVRLVDEGLKRGALGGNIGEIAGRLRSRAFETWGSTVPRTGTLDGNAPPIKL